MNEQWKELRQCILSGQPFVVVSIVEKSGSAPRKTGARMIVKQDLSISGTIGGGRLEAEAIAQAKVVLDEKSSRVTAFELTGKDASEMEMICGGTGKLLMVYVDPQSEDQLNLLEALSDCEKENKGGWLLTAIDAEGKARQYMMAENGKIVRSTLPFTPCTFTEQKGIEQCLRDYETMLGQKLYAEKIEKRFDLYLFGAGHVAQRVAPIAESVGFNTIVIDDRMAYGNLERFPNSKIILVPSLESALPDLPIDKRSYVAIMTRGHLQDKDILCQMLKYSPGYIGMIGSKRKRDLIYKSLIENEGYSAPDFDRVHCPIGIDISAESPEEIAISIVAELIRVRANA